jgi:2-methylisocitrate lyase-like PEP mutase family enzyme
VRRGIAYAKDGGVDAVWMNTMTKREEIAEACRRIPVPVIAPYYGPKPSPTFEEFQKLGVSAVLYPSLTTANGLQSTWEVLHEMKERGPVVLDEWNKRAQASKYAWYRVLKIRSCRLRKSCSSKKILFPRNFNATMTKLSATIATDN